MTFNDKKQDTNNIKKRAEFNQKSLSYVESSSTSKPEISSNSID